MNPALEIDAQKLNRVDLFLSRSLRFWLQCFVKSGACDFTDIPYEYAKSDAEFESFKMLQKNF